MKFTSKEYKNKILVNDKEKNTFINEKVKIAIESLNNIRKNDDKEALKKCITSVLAVLQGNPKEDIYLISLYIFKKFSGKELFPYLDNIYALPMQYEQYISLIKTMKAKKSKLLAKDRNSDLTYLYNAMQLLNKNQRSYYKKSKNILLPIVKVVTLLTVIVGLAFIAPLILEFIVVILAITIFGAIANLLIAIISQIGFMIGKVFIKDL